MVKRTRNPGPAPGRATLMRVLTVLFLFASVVAAQEGAKDKAPGPADVEIGDPGVAIKDPAVAKQRVAQFRGKLKAAADDAARAARDGAR